MAEPPSTPDPTLVREIRAVHAFYQALEPSCTLGGKLLFASILNDEAAQLIRAANIAGAASLTVSASPDELRKAQRNGVVDFLVTSLDEALRILKNEIRKRLPVAVAIEGSPLEVGKAMLVRGVQPDLLAPAAAAIQPLCARAAFLERGARLVEPQPEDPAAPLHIWPVPAAWNARLAALDAQLGKLLPADACAERRWLRLSPRYLGAAARRLRSVACDEDASRKFVELLG
jgi:hypothetical protein